MSMLEFLNRETETCEILTTRYAGARRLLYKNYLSIIIEVFRPLLKERKGDFMAKQTNSLAHTKWMCKYHIIFTPKYRRKIVYNQYKTDLRDILKCRITIYVWQTYIYKNFGIFFRRVVNTILFWFSNAGI